MTASRFRVGALFVALVGMAFASMACGPSSASAQQQAIVVRPAVVTATPPPAATPTASPSPSPTPAPVPTVRAVERPTSGRWIDVDVTRYVVTLMDGKQAVKEIGPVAVGRAIDTGAYESTQTGLFYVYNKTADRTFDAPYNTYIEHWVGFDIDKANGFHSFLEDKDGKVVDPATGRVSNGCIRTGESKAIFEYAEVGMPVLVHA